MQPKNHYHPRVEQDYLVFFLFMTAVLTGMYIWTLAIRPDLRASWMVIPFTILFFIHVLAHWNVARIIQKPGSVRWYIILQSLLAFVLVYISGNIGMIFALYMALVGETIGFLGANRWSLLAIIYYLGLSALNYILINNLESAFFWLLSSIPVVIFVSMYVTLYIRQTEARERAQLLADELEAANRQLSEYSARVEDLTIANERQRMARELHDTLSQGLAGLILQLEAVDAHLAGGRAEKARAIITNAMLNARATLADARRAIDDLRRDNSGDLQELLRFEVARFETATGIPCAYQAHLAGPVSEAVKETVIRAAAEVLTNIAQHARASGASLSIETTDDSLNITVRDDGQGFDPAQIPAGHYGLLGLRERIRLSNGTLSIQSAPGKGAAIQISIPV
jgi:NarL family two-component system sensor histidine kinase YdfH